MTDYRKALEACAMSRAKIKQELDGVERNLSIISKKAYNETKGILIHKLSPILGEVNHQLNMAELTLELSGFRYFDGREEILLYMYDKHGETFYTFEYNRETGLFTSKAFMAALPIINSVIFQYYN